MTKDTQGRESDPRVTTNRAAAAIPIHGLHHYAYRCRDAEETRHFYEDILGLPLWHIIQSDYVPSTGEYCPYTHIFFRMSDGACVAFFDLGDDEAAQPSPNTPAGSTIWRCGSIRWSTWSAPRRSWKSTASR
jgi:catechol 2,3-dioxygenase-like lactoylglutathione lyase family enzyme